MATLYKLVKRRVRRVSTALRTVIVQNSTPWMRQTFGPAAYYADMLFVDHGIFRVVYLNRHKLSNNVWRSAQPTPQQIGRVAADGIKTIVNLRGERVCGSFVLEQEACRRHGITLRNFKVRSRAAPTREELLAAKELFETVEYPMLMHCKSGADRAGLMSVLYKFVHEGVPLDVAKRELSLRYGHIRQADTGVLDYFFERYAAYNARTPIAFWDWVDTVYDPDEVKSSFMAKGWANRIVNGVLARE